MLTLPFPIIANEAWWASAEVGRQPWVVYGLMRTAEGASTNVVAGETIFTLAGFAGIYAFLILLYVFLALREVLNGPTPAVPA
jgi:cytochrome d ubiquinol oxidase subunit I